MVQKIFIIDVAGYLYRAYFAIPPMTNARGESTNALYGFIRSVLKIIKDFSPEHIVAVFDGPDNKKQRSEIYEKYKIHRDKAPGDLPLQMELAKIFCDCAGIPHIEVPGVEADDTMGSIAVWADKLGAEVFLCTSDKDLCQLVNAHIHVLNTYKNNLILDEQKVEETYGVPPSLMADLLAIAGDSSDNIPGISGFGPKTAALLLKEFGSLEFILQNPSLVPGKKKQETLIYETEIARVSKKLATIYTDVDFPKENNFFLFKGLQSPSLKQFYLDMNFNSLVRELENAPEAFQPQAVLPPTSSTNYQLIDDLTSLDELMKTLSAQNMIAFGVEATLGHPLQVELIGLGFSFQEATAYYVPFNSNLTLAQLQQRFIPLFKNNSIQWICHHAKLDIHILEAAHFPPPPIFFDTLLASYLLNSHSHKHSLDQLMLQYFGKVKTPLKELIGSGKKEISLKDVPLDKIAQFCSEDVDYTLRLFHLLKKQLQDRGLEQLHDNLELPLAKVLSKMEKAGIYLDVPFLQAMSVEIAKDIAQLETDIYALAGETFNISSPKQMSTILFEKMGIKPLKKTATGLSTNADVLDTLSLNYPIAVKILEYRLLEKLRSTYIDALPLEVNPQTHRIHCTFNQSVAATGRLSCQDPNLQNIPVRTSQGKKIRAAFHPQKAGWSFVAADYSQIELRLLAHLSEDPKLIEAFVQGEDIHAFTASLMFGIPLEAVSQDQRHQAKAINFGIIYGQQAFGLAQELGIEVSEAAAFIEAYFQRYPQVRSFLNSCKEYTRQTGKAVTMIGREREIPEIHSHNGIIRAAAERLAINTPLQGTAADLIKMAMLTIDRKLTENNMQGYMILQIHDELIFEVPQNELEPFIALVKQAMESVFSLKVPLVIDVIIGKNWKEC